MMIVFAKPCTNCLRVALGLIFIITIIQRWTVKNVVHCVKVSPARHKKNEKKQNKKTSLWRLTSPLAVWNDVSNHPVMSYLAVIKCEWRHDLRVQKFRFEWHHNCFPSILFNVDTIPMPFCFVFFFCLFCLFCWKLHRHCKGSHRTPSLPPVASSLFGFFLHSMHFFRHIYSLCYNWCISVLHSCNYIYFWCSSTWQTCLMCTIFS